MSVFPLAQGSWASHMVRSTGSSCLLSVAAMLSSFALAAGGGEAREDERLINLDGYANVQTRPGQDEDLTLVVAISGGGYRAANFALGALLALEQVEYGDGSNLLNEVDYFSTVSGGGLAAAAATMARLAPGVPCDRSRCDPLATYVSDEDVIRSLRTNHMPRLVYSRLFPSVLLTRKTSGDDFQVRLDKTILRSDSAWGSCGEQGKPPRRSYRLGDIFKEAGQSNPCVAYWFMNATDVATGRIVPITPWRTKQEGVRAYWHSGDVDVCGRDGSRCDYGAVPIALGLRTSMNFPAGIPSTRLTLKGSTEGQRGAGGEPRPYDRPSMYMYLTDGGESDNVGALVAAAILNQEPAILEKNNASSDGRKRLLIVIDAFRGLGVKNYDTPDVPSLFNSILRTTSLPLDAHRFRITQDFYRGSVRQLSVLDAISDSGDVSVAYVDMRNEPTALDVGTSLGLSGDDQHALICAGKRQALIALGDTRLWKERVQFTRPGGKESSVAELNCPEYSVPAGCSGRRQADGACTSMVAFNSQRKSLLARKLADGYRLAMDEVTRRGDVLSALVEQAVRGRSQAYRNEEVVEHLKRFRGSQVVPSSSLDAEELDSLKDTIEDYKRRVGALRDDLTSKDGDLSVDEVNPTDDETAESASKEPPQESWWSRLLRRFGWRGEDENREMEREREDGVKEEGNEEGNEEEERSEVPPRIDERKKKMIEDALEEMDTIAARALELVRDEKVLAGEFTALDQAVASLDEPHSRLLAAFPMDRLSWGRHLLEKINALSAFFTNPWKSLAGIRDLFQARLKNALKVSADNDRKAREEAEEKWSAVGAKVEADVEAYRGSEISDALRSMDMSALATRPDILGSATVCSFLQHSSKALASTRQVVEELLAGSFEDTKKWDLAEGLWDREYSLTLMDQLEGAKDAIEDSERELERLRCIWPDLNRRDRFSYRDFDSFGDWAKFEVARCRERERLPYGLACAPPVHRKSGP